MTCKNCGADLKPGVKYCLNCGNYLDEDEEEVVEEGVSLEELNREINMEEDTTDDDSKKEKKEKKEKKKEKKKKKKKKSKLNVGDILIYCGLVLIIVISMTVIVITAVNGSKKKEPPMQQIVDNKVKMSNYTVTLSGKLKYSVEGNIIYITDGENFKISYQNSEDDFSKYESNLDLLSKDLEQKGNEVVKSGVKEKKDAKFIVYDYKEKEKKDVKHLYITKVNDKYITIGMIEMIKGDNYDDALSLIGEINKSIKFNSEEKN